MHSVLTQGDTHHLWRKKVNVGPDLVSRRIIREKRKENFKNKKILLIGEVINVLVRKTSVRDIFFNTNKHYNRKKTPKAT